MRKLSAGVMGLLGLVLAAGPSSCSPASPSVASNCFSELTVSSRGHTAPIASCAGQIGLNPLPQLTVRPGDVITIKGLDAPTFTAPASTAPSVVSVRSVDGLTAKLKATTAGSAVITLQTTSCLVPHASKACPTLSITVTAE